jgi:hypothetical protein
MSTKRRVVEKVVSSEQTTADDDDDDRGEKRTGIVHTTYFDFGILFLVVEAFVAVYFVVLSCVLLANDVVNFSLITQTYSLHTPLPILLAVVLGAVGNAERPEQFINNGEYFARLVSIVVLLLVDTGGLVALIVDDEFARNDQVYLTASIVLFSFSLANTAFVLVWILVSASWAACSNAQQVEKAKMEKYQQLVRKLRARGVTNPDVLASLTLFDDIKLESMDRGDLYLLDKE